MIQEQEFNQLFFSSYADLCEAAAGTALDDAQAGKENAVRIAANAQQLSEASDAKLAKVNAGAAFLSEKVNVLRDEDARAFSELAERALTGDAELDTESRISTDRRSLLAQTRDIVEHSHRVILPRERLTALTNQAVLLAARANLSSYCALEAGIVRYLASKPLLEKDGSVTFGEQGTAYEAFKLQMHAHRQATEAVAAVEAEQARQRMLAAQGVL